MATANLLWTVPSLTMIAPTPRPNQLLTFGQPPSHFTAGGSAAEFFAFSLAHLVAGQLSRGERNGGFLTRREKIPARRAPFSYTPPTSSFTLRLSSRHAAMPITPVLKGSGGNMNSSSFWALSFWDNLAQTDEKFPRLCRAAKEDSTIAVAELKDDTQVAKRKFHRSTRRSGGEQSRKIYAIIAGASFCAVVVIFSIVLPKQQGLRGKVDPELLYTSLEKFFSDLRCKVVPKLSSVSWEKILGIAPAWISILLACYELNDKQNMGKMRNRKPSKKQPITFDDVEGVDAAKVELLEIVLCMEEDSKYMKLGAKVPRGVLLAGPPGTGKTLLARAVAGEADVAFFSISASEFVEIYVGRGAAHVRDLFREARKRSPSIIFIDEIDAIGGQRGKGQNCEGDQTLNQLLTEMDGFEKDAKVVVIAATNRPESLDSALMRPGRFSRKVFVGEPDLDARRKIFSLYLQKVPMKEDKEAICDLVASLTPGLVGADLENIANESVLLAARRDDDFVTKEDVLQAVERAKTKI